MPQSVWLARTIDCDGMAAGSNCNVSSSASSVARCCCASSQRMRYSAVDSVTSPTVVSSDSACGACGGTGSTTAMACTMSTCVSTCVSTCALTCGATLRGVNSITPGSSSNAIKSSFDAKSASADIVS